MVKILGASIGCSVDLAVSVNKYECVDSITKIGLSKYIKNFTSKNLKIFR